MQSAMEENKMETECIFTSKIPLNENIYAELYDLLEPKAAVPVLQKNSKPEITNSLQIKTGKTYVSKRTLIRKVKTVRDIRKDYEQQIWENHKRDLEKQHNYFRECVNSSSLKEEHVLDHIKHVLTSTSPIMRSTWPILTTANVKNHSNPRQYVKWNGKTVLLHGSAGGSTEYLYNFDIANEIRQPQLIQNVDLQKNIPLKLISDKSNNRDFISENKILSNEKHKGDIEVENIFDESLSTAGVLDLDEEMSNVKNQTQILNKNKIHKTFQCFETELQSLNVNDLQNDRKIQSSKLIDTMECSYESQNNNDQVKCSCNYNIDFEGLHKDKEGITNKAIKLSANSECLSNKWLHGDKSKESKSMSSQQKKYIHQHNLSIHLARLNCPNIEPLCMEHELYRCFCKGKFSTNKLSKNMFPVTTPSDAVDDVPNSRKVSTRENIEYLLEKENIDKTYGAVKNNSAEITNSANALSQNIFRTSNTKSEDKKFKYEQILKCLMNNNDDEINTEISNIQIDECNNQSTIDNLMFHSVHSDDTTNSSHIVSEQSKFQRGTQIGTKTKLDTKKQRFSSWINHEYNHLKSLLAKGVEVTLRKPCPNKMMLIPYSDLVERYKLGKNVFLVNREHPNQVHIVIDPKHEDFKHLVNVDRINIEELYGHCDFLKHLRLNTPLKDNFVLLKGFHNSWEVVGLVSKRKDSTEITLPSTHKSNFTAEQGNICNSVNINTKEDKQTTNMDNSFGIIRDKLTSSSENTQRNRASFQSKTIAPTNSNLYNFGSQVCKWYYMAVGNDFVEVRFVNKKLFVKHSIIICTIDSAHSLNKTLCITLSKEKRSMQNNDLEFGIYINPHLPKNHILIGPCEQHEELHIILVRELNTKWKNNETSKDSVGIWLSTEKICNSVIINKSLPIFVEIQNIIARGVKRKIYNVRDNVHFVEKKMKTAKSDHVTQYEPDHTLETNTTESLESDACYKLSEQIICKDNHTDCLKISKPINRLKIAHHDTNCTKPINKSQFYLVPKYPIITAVGTLVENTSSEKSQSDVENTKKSAEPEIEQDQFTPLYSDEVGISVEVETEGRCRTTDAMEIPADFNTEHNHSITSNDKKLGAENEILKTYSSQVNTDQLEVPSEFEIEEDHSIHTHSDKINNCGVEITMTTNPSTYANSDEMKISSNTGMVKVRPKKRCKFSRPYESVKIVCINVENFGYLNGQRDRKNYISFQYPCSEKFSFFYIEDSAFRIINAFFNKDMHIEKPLQLKWKVVSDEDESETGNMFRIMPDIISSHIITNNGKLIKKLRHD